MKVGIKLGKVKKFGIGWCIPHRMAADKAEGGSAWYRVKMATGWVLKNELSVYLVLSSSLFESPNFPEDSDTFACLFVCFFNIFINVSLLVNSIWLDPNLISI